MRVQAVRNNYEGCPASIRDLGFTSHSQVSLISDKEYDVWAVARWRGVLFFQLIDELGYPNWFSAWLFRLTDSTIPENWICNIFEDEVEMVIGPRFVAGSKEEYYKMVELDPSAVDAFWRHVNKNKPWKGKASGNS